MNNSKYNEYMLKIWPTKNINKITNIHQISNSGPSLYVAPCSFETSIPASKTHGINALHNNTWKAQHQVSLTSSSQTVKLSYQHSYISISCDKPCKLGLWSSEFISSLCMQDYKSLCGVVVICATLVNTNTQLLTYTASSASWAEN